MLEIMRIGDQGVGRIIACGQVVEKGRDLWHGGTGVVEELNLQGSVITRDSSNGHCPPPSQQGKAFQHGYDVHRRLATSSHGRRGGSSPREPRRGRVVGAGGAHSASLSPVRKA